MNWEKKNEYVKGIELNGNPYKGAIYKIIELMNYSKSLINLLCT